MVGRGGDICGSMLGHRTRSETQTLRKGEEEEERSRNKIEKISNHNFGFLGKSFDKLNMRER